MKSLVTFALDMVLFPFDGADGCVDGCGGGGVGVQTVMTTVPRAWPAAT